MTQPKQILKKLNNTFGDPRAEWSPKVFLRDLSTIIKDSQDTIAKEMKRVGDRKIEFGESQEIKELVLLTNRLIDIQEMTQKAIEQRRVEKVIVDRVLPSPKVDVNLVKSKSEKAEWQGWWLKALKAPVDTIRAAIREVFEESKTIEGAIAVRLVDKDQQTFYNAITTAVSGGLTIPSPLPVTQGLSIPAHDFEGFTYPNDVTEVIAFKTGGSGGTTVATLTIIYESDTKEVVTSITKT